MAGDPVDPVPRTSRADREVSGERVLLRMPVDVRSVSTAVLAVLASLFALQWANEIVIPILFGVMLSYALTPIVSRMYRWRIPRGVAAAVLLMSIFGSLVWGASTLSDQVDALVETLPKVRQKLRELTRREYGEASTIEKVQKVAAELEAVAVAVGPAPTHASGSAEGSVAPSRQRPIVVAPTISLARIDIPGFLLSGTLRALAFLGQLIVVFFVALFLLASGNDFRRKMIRLTGPRLSQKKITIETLDEISEQIQRYLLVQLGVSLAVGVATWLAFYAIGLNQSAVWGVVAGVTNLVPYVGAVLVGGASAVVGLVQFGTAEMALLVGATSFAIHTLIGNVMAPWWMGRAGRMSPIAVFITVLLFGWLWGVAGLVLGVPILLAIKAVCDRVEDLKPIGEILGTLD